MKKVAAMILGVALTSSYASAGTVVFTSANPTIDISAPAAVDFGVMITPAGGSSDAIDLVIGSDLGVSFAYDPALPFANITAPFIDSGFYTHDAFLSVTNSSPINGPVLLGTVTLDPAGLSLTLGQTFEVVVDPAQDFDISGASLAGVLDPLSGSTTVTVVPEPATMTLLGLAAIGLVRRRRSA